MGADSVGPLETGFLGLDLALVLTNCEILVKLFKVFLCIRCFSAEKGLASSPTCYQD